MDVPLTPRAQEILQQEVAGGKHGPAEQVIEQALEMLHAYAQLDGLSPEQLVQVLAPGLADLECGRYIELEERNLTSFVDSVAERGLERYRQNREQVD